MLSHLCPRLSRAATSPSTHSASEPLEPRRLMSAATEVTQVDYLGGVQLRVTGTDGDDQINVRFDPNLGYVVTNTADASTTLYGGDVKTVRVDGGAGNDSITIDWTVARRAFLYGGDGDDALVGARASDYLSGGAGMNTLDGGEGDDVLVTVGGGVNDRLTGGGGTDSFWLDTKKTEVITDLAPAETLAGGVHRVGSFFSRVRDPLAKTPLGNVSLAAKELPDPGLTDYRFTYGNFADYPVFGELGPKPDDVAQGALGDCYSLVVFSSVAAINPGKIRESVVDLGDGTFAVQFRRGSARYYVRVDADLPVYPDSGAPGGGRGAGGVPVYAALGAQDALWVALLEKAHAVVRTPSGSYAGLEAGWMREGYALLGSKSKSFWTNSADLLMRTIQVLVGANRSVTFGTDQAAAGTPLLSNHAYTVVGVDTDSAGNATALRVRNPWGEDGAGSDGSDDGYLVITPQQALSALGGVSTAIV